MDTALTSDLDEVLENINLLIGDMEDSLMSSSSSSNLSSKSGIENSAWQDDNHTVASLTEDTDTDDTDDMSFLAIPRVHHDFASDGLNRSTDTTTLLLQNNENFEKTKDTVNYVKKLNLYDETIKSRKIKHDSKRLYSSAENSPVLNTRRVQLNPNVEYRDRANSISPRLFMPNIEKFDVEILCPDAQFFKAGVFKAWTAFQLAWKIAHVKGMIEKLALVVQEIITDLHLVRQMEDHEIVYTVMQNWAPDSNNSLRLVEQHTKYGLFNEPADYLPIELVDFSRAPLDGSSTKSRRSSLLKSIMTADKSPGLQGWVYMKDFDKKNWQRKYLRLHDSSLFLCNSEEDEEEELVCSCRSSYMYECLPEFNTAHGSPEPYGFCIIPEVVSEWSQIKCFCAESQRTLTGWSCGIRLAKYGQQLYLNFREAMSKEANLRRTNSARQSILFRRSYDETTTTIDNKATIDFSGDNGRVVSDPVEALKIQNELAFEIPKTSKRRSATFSPAVVRKTILENKVWYHGKLNRDQAVNKLKKHGLREGLFLVRDSSSSHGNLVLTVVTKNRKLAHHQIFQSFSHSGVPLYGIEHGPQFSSLELLVESYHSGAVEGVDFTLKKPCPS